MLACILGLITSQFVVEGKFANLTPISKLAEQHAMNDIGRLPDFSRPSKNASNSLLNNVQSVNNKVKTNCSLGQVGDKCECMDKVDNDIVQCLANGTVHVLKNHWLFVNEKTGLLETRPCLPGHCKCQQPVGDNGMSCVMNLTHQCAYKYRGNLCSKCEEGYSTKVFSGDCAKCSFIWILSIPVYIVLTIIATLAIIKLNFSEFGGYCNALFYYYQITFLFLPVKVELWPPVAFIVGLSSLTGRGFSDSRVSGICLAPGVDEMDLLIINLFLPIIAIGITYLHLNNPIQRWRVKPTTDYYSNGGPLSTIIIIVSGKMMLAVTQIFRTVEINSLRYHYEAASYRYLDEYKSWIGFIFAVIFAIAILGFVFLLIFIEDFNKPCFTRLRINRLEKIFRAFREPFNRKPTKDDNVATIEKTEKESGHLRKFAGFYFACRIVLYVNHELSYQAWIQLMSQSIVSTIFLAVFIYWKPYRNKWHNICDSTVLFVLSVQGWLSLSLSIPHMALLKNTRGTRITLNVFIIYPTLLLLFRIVLVAGEHHRGIKQYFRRMCDNYLRCCCCWKGHLTENLLPVSADIQFNDPTEGEQTEGEQTADTQTADEQTAVYHGTFSSHLHYGTSSGATEF